MLSADAVQRGRSLFADRRARRSPPRCCGSPTTARRRSGLASAPFDGEGSPRRRHAADRGRAAARRSCTTRAPRARTAARRPATPARASYRTPPSVGTSNLVIDPGDGRSTSSSREAGDGLYVTDVAGLHSGVNPVSGTFSVGATGRLIEGGELGRPVREITIASDLVSMLRAVDAIGLRVALGALRRQREGGAAAARARCRFRGPEPENSPFHGPKNPASSKKNRSAERISSSAVRSC